MQAGLHFCASRGSVNGFAGVGGEKRSGGLTAKGMPRNLLTVTVADGNTVVVPMTTPTSMVAVGKLVEAGAWGWPSEIWLTAVAVAAGAA